MWPWVHEYHHMVSIDKTWKCSFFIDMNYGIKDTFGNMFCRTVYCLSCSAADQHTMNLLFVKTHTLDTPYPYTFLAPVPLAYFDENSECSSFEYTRLITTIFCTHHDSDTVVTWAKYRCDRPCIFYTKVFWIFIEFRIRSKYACGTGAWSDLHQFSSAIFCIWCQLPLYICSSWPLFVCDNQRHILHDNCSMKERPNQCKYDIDGSVKDYSNSSALIIDLPQSWDYPEYLPLNKCMGQETEVFNLVLTWYLKVNDSICKVTLFYDLSKYSDWSFLLILICICWNYLNVSFNAY